MGGCIGSSSKNHGGSMSEDYYYYNVTKGVGGRPSNASAVAAAAAAERQMKNFTNKERTTFKFDKQEEYGFTGAKKTAYWGKGSAGNNRGAAVCVENDSGYCMSPT